MAWIEGPDVSKWQGDIDWQRLKDRGAKFVMIRIGYGGSQGIAYDERADENIQGARSVDLPWGGYWYFHPKQDVKTQASWLLAKLREHYPFQIPPTADLEEPPVSVAALLPAVRSEPTYAMGSRLQETAALDALEAIQPRGGISEGWHNLAANAYVFLDEVRKGLARMEIFNQPLVYTNWSFWNLMGRPTWGAEFALWIAAWTNASSPAVPSTWDAWTFWQYTNSAPGAEWGVSIARLDMNRFYATDLQPYLIQTMPPKPPARKIIVALVHPTATREQARQIANIRYPDKAIVLWDLIDAQTLLDFSNASEDSQLLVYGYGRFTPAEREVIRQYNWSQRAMPK